MTLRTLRAFLLLIALLTGISITALPAAAHVNFLGSTPANVSTVDGPITRIVLEYSGSSDPIDSDFLIQDATGASQPIESVGKDGDTKVIVTSVDPLPAGRNKVSWALRGADGHAMTGTISFTVSAASSTVTSSVASPMSTSSSTSTSTSSDDGLARSIANIGRWLVYAMVLFSVSSLAYLVWVHRGSRREGRRIVFLTRRAAILVIIGSVIEWLAQLVVNGSGSLTDVVSPSAWSSLLSTGFALGTLCRIVGAGLVLRFMPLEVVAADPIDFAELDDYDLFGELSGSGGPVAVVPPTATQRSRVRVESSPWVFAGALLLVFSESFIGHTASVEPRGLVIISDAVHLMAAAIWVAGVWLLAWTLWQRQRRGEPLDARLVATRFSVTATWALVAVAISGTALGWVILGEPGRLLSTEFGRLLVIKVLLVTIIGGIGLHNRRTLIPNLERPGVDARFLWTIAIEGALFVVVLAVSALLVVSNPLS